MDRAGTSCFLGPPPPPDGQFREFPAAGVFSHRSTSLLVPSVAGSTYLSSPEVPGLNQGDTSLRSGVRFHFQRRFFEKGPPGGDLIRPLRHHLWSLQMFTILLQFLEMAVFFWWGGGHRLVTDG